MDHCFSQQGCSYYYYYYQAYYYNYYYCQYVNHWDALQRSNVMPDVNKTNWRSECKRSLTDPTLSFRLNIALDLSSSSRVSPATEPDTMWLKYVPFIGLTRICTVYDPDAKKNEKEKKQGVFTGFQISLELLFMWIWDSRVH